MGWLRIYVTLHQEGEPALSWEPELKGMGAGAVRAGRGAAHTSGCGGRARLPGSPQHQGPGCGAGRRLPLHIGGGHPGLRFYPSTETSEPAPSHRDIGKSPTLRPKRTLMAPDPQSPALVRGPNLTPHPFQVPRTILVPLTWPPGSHGTPGPAWGWASSCSQGPVLKMPIDPSSPGALSDAVTAGRA